MRQLAARLMHAAAPCSTAAWLTDVWAHVERVLNTSMGSSLSAPTYGVPGGAESVRQLLEQLPTSALALEQGVILALRAHERRITAWRTRQPPEWGKRGLTLHLTGDVRGAPAGVEVTLVVHLLPSGHAQVRPA